MEVFLIGMKMKLHNKRGARLGQHFLTSRSAAARVAGVAGITPGITVLEIGPGKGILTRELLACGGHVVAVEKDPALIPILEATFSKEVRSGRLRIVQADVRDITPERLGLSHYVLAANIPYYITGEIIRQFLTARIQPQVMSLLVQKEVAERIVHTKKESILSLSVKVYGTPRYIQTVKAGSFSPPPSVDSAILAISNVSRKFFTNISEEHFFKVVRTGFSSKRKLLLSNLARIFGRDTVETAFVQCGIHISTRAEDVGLEKWACLTANSPS